jgi:hypothetical protein
MKGHQIAGTSLNRERIENDFYATPEESTKALLAVEGLLYPVLEPACGAGHISRLIGRDDGSGDYVISSDLIDRGYGCKNVDFLADDFIKNMVNLGVNIHAIKTIITNPPFSLFQEFAEKGLSLHNVKKVILFGKLQALEGQRRATFMENSPLRTVYVFKSRQNPLRNGSPVDEKWKSWASTMAFAWYVWEKGYTGETIIKWI